MDVSTVEILKEPSRSLAGVRLSKAGTTVSIMCIVVAVISAALEIYV